MTHSIIMSAVSSESGSDTTLETQERPVSPMSGSKRKSVIDTRRAEQNRAAQRAFRQRKEVYVKELENKVRDMEILKDRLERLEIENERLKYRVWELESSPTLTSVTAPTSSSSNSSSSASSYHKTHAYGDETCTSGDTQQRQQQHNHWQPYPTDTTPKKAVKTTEMMRPSLSPSSPPQQHSVGSAALPPPSPSPSVFRPIPVAYWEKDSSSNKRHRSTSTSNNGQQQQHYHAQQQQQDDTTPSEHGQVLDDLASILRTHHRPPLHHHRQKEQRPQQRQDQPEPELMHT